MNESILSTIKAMLDIDLDDTSFDVDVITNINSAFSSLNLIGVGPTLGYSIAGLDETWSDFIGDNNRLMGVKTYIYMKAKLIFDPPNNSFKVAAMERQLEESGWTLGIQSEESIDE